MKKAFLISIAFYLLNLVNAIQSKEQEEIICPNPQDPADCYPKIFIATNNWQTIREGQEIPPGLHVRLNMDTLQKEAKLMSNEEEGSEPQNELIVGENNEESEETESNPNQHILDAANEILKHQQNSKPHKSKVKKEDMSELDSAIYEVENYQTSNAEDDKVLLNLLEAIEDLSHDIELGAKITSNSEFISKLLSIGSTSPNSEISEKSYNIIASSLRNNPEAIDNIISSQPDLVNHLFDDISRSKNDKVQKRELGIIQALIQNSNFKAKLANLNNEQSGINKLIKLYSKLGPESQRRSINIINDLELTTKTNDRRSIEETDPNSNFSNFLQALLIEKKLNKDNFQNHFKDLVDLHSDNSKLKPNNQFLKWLSEEVETRKERNLKIKRDVENVDDQLQKDLDFDDYMLRARHEIFGNPMGLRKAIADEL
ncbi:SIL1 [Candida pseudojiufengensis]|uniref:SIL1 n=1 Tax=Candida pseudojiufengensis TaxID=497109 RepID=UPI00222543DF|nr:SIL1 [Candida pseudojiufengensis]KAI5962667.1 SIL1 [Candida pseudojiufengensis]